MIKYGHPSKKTYDHNWYHYNILGWAMSSIKCDLKELQYLPVSDAACIVLENVHILEIL